MVDERAGRQVAVRIGFAERWLVSAKRQVAEGNVARGLLTLVLADAEVRHALEAAGAVPAARRTPALLAPLLIVLAAAALVVAAVLPAPLPDTSAGAPSVVHLVSRVGALLELVPGPLSQPTEPVLSSSPPGPIHARAAPRRTLSPSKGASAYTAARSSPVITARPVLAPAASAGASGGTLTLAAPASPVAPAAQAAPATTMELSTGELIDLVLAAERALRSEPARR